MKFASMVKELLNNPTMIAYNEDYPDLLTNVRLCDKKNAGNVLYYYQSDSPTVPVIITKEVWDSDGWDVIDDYSERLSIQSFMRMPNAKQFIRELYDTINSEWNGRFEKGFTEKEGYQFRMREAIALNIVIGNTRNGRLYFTDIGEDLIKTL